MSKFARNIRDAALRVSRALTASDGTVRSPDIDLGCVPHAIEMVEVAIQVPALTTTELPNADTVTVALCTGNTAVPTAVHHTFPAITGAGGEGAPATELRARIPSNAGRYLNATFTSAGTSGNMSGKSAVVELLF